MNALQIDRLRVETATTETVCPELRANSEWACQLGEARKQIL